MRICLTISGERFLTFIPTNPATANMNVKLQVGGEIRIGFNGSYDDGVGVTPPGTDLVYRLKCDAAARDINASFRNGVLEVRVPESNAREWCTTSQVTLAHEQELPEGALRITLEKDFACLAPREGEDESDSFPHPEAGSGKTC